MDSDWGSGPHIGFYAHGDESVISITRGNFSMSWTTVSA
jgi:hypothetical protein